MVKKHEGIKKTSYWLIFKNKLLMFNSNGKEQPF
jgi:hypothetical protein